MEPIKCNCFSNHSSPLDMKSQPLKLTKITSPPMAVQNSSSQFLLQQMVVTIFFYPLSPQFKLVVLLHSSTTQAYSPGKPPIQLPTLP
ncbi:hypothetical protein Hdeb2414_s0020g00565461 [Helianthus debilis subsp. tardiflorus]